MKREREFKYLSKEKRKELERMFKFLESCPRYPLPTNYEGLKDYYDLDKHFEQFSLPQHNGMKFKLTPS